MKYILIAFCICFLFFSPRIAAQSAATDTGSSIISGSARISSSGSSLGGGRGFEISISPNYLHFIAPKLAIGGNLSLGFSSLPGFNSFNVFTASLGPEINYFFDQGQPVMPFISIGGSFGGSFSNADNDAFNTNNSSFTLSGGLVYRIEHIGIFAEAGFSNLWNKRRSSNVRAVNFSDLFIQVGIAGFLFEEEDKD